MAWIRRVWRWIDTPIEERYQPSNEPVIRTPLDLFDEAIDDVKSYITYLEMEGVTKDEAEDYDWHGMEVISLEVSLELIHEAIAMLRPTARLGQEGATGAEQ